MIEQTLRRFDPRALVWFAWAIVMCSVATAGEAPAAAAAAAAAGPDLLTLIMEALLPAVIGIVTYILHRKGKYKGLVQDVMEALDTGRHVAHHEYTKALKEAAEDGKLTDTEKAEARKRAFSVAAGELKGPALAMLKSWGEKKVGKILSGLVEKAKGSIAKRIGG